MHHLFRYACDLYVTVIIGFYQGLMHQKASKDLVPLIIIEENNTVRSIHYTSFRKPACYPSSEWIL